MGNVQGSDDVNHQEVSEVLLNVYDVDHPDFAELAKLMPKSFGIYHSGVEVHGVEYGYAGGCGVYLQQPRNNPLNEWVFKEQVLIGYTTKSKREVKQIIEQLKTEFLGKDYHVINQNCNHFADTLCRTLSSTGIPNWINRVARLGSTAQWIFGEEFLIDSAHTIGRKLGTANQMQEEPQHEEEKGEESIDLVGYICTERVRCLNQSIDHPISNLFSNSWKFFAFFGKTYLSSEDGKDMLINIPFSCPVNLHTILIYGHPDREPLTVLVFVNMENISFTTCNDTTALIKINSVKPSFDQPTLIPLADDLFNHVSNIVLLVRGSEGNEGPTIVSGLTLFGTPS